MLWVHGPQSEAKWLLMIWNIIPYDSIIHSFQKGSISNVQHVFKAQVLRKALRDNLMKGSSINVAVTEGYLLCTSSLNRHFPILME